MTEVIDAAENAFGLLLFAFPKLRELPQDELRYLLRDKLVYQPACPGGRVLFTQGTPVTTLYLVINGVVEEARTPPLGEQGWRILGRTVTGNLSEGGQIGPLLGIYDLFYSTTYSTTATTDSLCDLLVLDVVGIERLLQRFPPASNYLAPLPWIGRLSTMPLLGGLRKVQIGFIADACRYPLPWTAGEVIYEEGAPATTLYLIDTGQVVLHDAGEERHWLGNGAAFGLIEASAMNFVAANLAHQATATVPTSTYVIEREAYRRIVGHAPEEEGYALYAAVDETLRTVPGLETIEDDLRHKLAGFVSHYYMPNNHIILQQGEHNDSLWILMPGGRGQVHAFDGSGAAFQRIGVEGPAYFGERALYFDRPVGAAVEAEEGSQWLRLHRDDLTLLDAQAGHELKKRLPLLPTAAAAAGRVEPRLELQAGESIEMVQTRHWLVLIGNISFAVTVLFVLLLLSLGVVLGRFAPTAYYTPLVAIGGIIALLQLAWGLIDYLNDYLIVTNRRLILNEEVIFFKQWRQQAPLDRVLNVDVAIGFVGRFLGYGNVVIHTAGTAGNIVFNYVSNYSELRDRIFRARDERRNQATAESKRMVQRLLEGRLGLEPSLPARVLPAITPRNPQSLTAWQQFTRRVRALLRYSSVALSSEDHVVWRKHWLIVLRNALMPGLILLLILVALLGQSLIPIASVQQFVGALDLLFVFLGLVDFVWLVWVFEDWRNDTYELTNENIIDVVKKPFFFSENRRTARLSDIENIEIDIPSPIHYLLNFGNVKLQTAATQGDFTFDFVPDPRAVAAEIQRRIEEYYQRTREAENRRRVQELPDWFDMYDLLGGVEKRRARPPLTRNAPAEPTNQNSGGRSAV